MDSKACLVHSKHYPIAAVCFGSAVARECGFEQVELHGNRSVPSLGHPRVQDQACLIVLKSAINLHHLRNINLFPIHQFISQ